MRGAGYGLLVLGVIIAIVGLLNKFAVLHLGFNLLGHTTTVIIGVGAVLAVIGLLMSFMGGRSEVDD